MSTVVRTGFVGTAALLLACVCASAAQETVPLSRFQGTWVGLQNWTIENPSAEEPQTVTLTLEMEEGALTGSLAPFLGLRAGATITDARVVGNELHATASAGARGWQGGVGVEFTFVVDADAMTGTADLTLGDIDWLELDYDLKKKQQRY